MKATIVSTDIVTAWQRPKRRREGKDAQQARKTQETLFYLGVKTVFLKRQWRSVYTESLESLFIRDQSQSHENLAQCLHT